MKKSKPRVDGQLVELAGREWLVSQLLKAGIEVARPERDHGVDLIAYIETHREFVACPIQVKACLETSFIVHNNKYKKIPGMLLVYVWHVDDSTKTVAYAMTPREALRIAETKGWTTKASWKSLGYWRDSKASKELLSFLEPHKMISTKWKAKVHQAMGRTKEGKKGGQATLFRVCGRAPRFQY